MKILVFGAGVIGSFNAARLKDAGEDVTLLARGRRLAELRQHGVVLEHYRTGARTVTQVPLVDRVVPEDDYDLAVVVVRRNQVPSVLAALAPNRRIPSVLFLGNNAAGSKDMVEALGRERVLIGMANAGGDRQGYVVRYVWTRRLSLLFGELDGVPTPRTQAIASLFRRAGLPARAYPDVDAYVKTHAAGLPAFAGALYSTGGSVRRLAHDPKTLRLFISAYREALAALRATGVPLKPPVVRLFEWLPAPLLALAWRLFLDTELAVVGGERHANAAPDEMKELADELREIFRQAGRPAQASDVLFAEVDARARAAAAEQAAGPPGPPPPEPEEHPYDRFGDDLSIPRSPVDDTELGGESGAGTSA